MRYQIALRLIIMNKLMLCFFNICVLSKTTTGFEDSYAVLKTGIFPTSSCLQYNNVRNSQRCLSTCWKTHQPFCMLSYNSIDHRCICCNDYTRIVLSHPGWLSYTIHRDVCPPCYTFYHSTNFTTCLMYVSKKVTYPEAVSNCAQDGGDLIRIDSQKKYDIFKSHLGPYANKSQFQVWVQGQEISGQWRFHDGTLIPGYCPLYESNNTGETSMRSRSNLDFQCRDVQPTHKCHYMCEI